jgi:hypothetical protein
MSTSKKRWLLFLLSLFLIVGLVPGVLAQGNNVDPNLLWGTNFSQSRFQSIVGLGEQDPRVTIAKVIRLLLGFLGIIAVTIIIYAGFIWMTSGGNEEKISKAKALLKNGVIGLIIILASFGIVAFIIRQLIGATTGGGGGGGGGGSGGGISGIGNGIIKSVYPEPFQRDVPRNTTIIVTFREAMKAATICDRVVTSGDLEICEPLVAKILPRSVKIFKSSELNGPFVEDVTVTSVDNKTFIFKPAGPRYLGEGNNDTNYTVNLTVDIKRANGTRAFTSLDGFRWTFTVKDDVLDLRSPKILEINNGGIFPLPDDDADTLSSTTPAIAAEGRITVNEKPSVYRAASAAITRLSPPSTPLKARVEGTNRCTDGTVTISLVDEGGILKASVNYSQEEIVDPPTPLPIINNYFDLSSCNLRVILEPEYSAGHSWKVETFSKINADTLTIGSKIYTFVASNPNANQIAVGSNNVATATSIKNSINSIDSSHPEVTATSDGNVVAFKAKVAGTAGNLLGLSASNRLALNVTAFSGGADLTNIYTINGKKDHPMNTVIQINFNEAINPLTISGSSTDVADKLRIINAASGALPNGGSCTEDKNCLSYKCSNRLCVGDQLAGTFFVSNQYKTAEFISDFKCGVNGCGESIYCLPKNSHLKVQVEAASLTPCASNTDCIMPGYTSCISNVCQNAENKNSPVASALNGIVDASNNSLDGNRNDNPQGKASTWNENLSIEDNDNRGDNYEWSFWISERLDLTTPEILPVDGLDVVNNQRGVGVSTAISIIFSKLMLSSSLSTGSVNINNGIETINHHLINLWSMASDPIGYWIQKENRDIDPLDGVPDQTKAILYHGTFNDSTLYRAQVGSGVKDIYQNCYKPSAGPTCTPNSSNPSCCRNSGGVLYPTSTLNPRGNCYDLE